MSEVKHAPLWNPPAFPVEGRLQAEAVKRRRQQRARESLNHEPSIRNPNAGPPGAAQPVVLDAEHLAQAMQDIDALWDAFYAQAGEVKNASA
ncbi:hypothetical protein D3C76_1226240 [compost metagenome]|jgi:hypothetical protein|uniref:hypothetical protein n=1 Tax=Pseudomonas TaxID=286 RepID=UPI000981CAAB|nr:hypothetical protein [Pseudomonas putida]OMQ40626.1 hypothetical protein BKX96_02145 [Pseudomonas putida]